MNGAAPTDEREPEKIRSTSTLQLPRLHPAPGRCIIRIVKRLGLSGELQTEGGVELALDGRYQNQPMIGALYEIGDPTTERERVIADWAIAEDRAGRCFMFSMYGSGNPYWDDEMHKMLPAGYDFRWLQGLRLFDIGQLSTSVEGSGLYGEDLRQRSVLMLPPHLKGLQ